MTPVSIVVADDHPIVLRGLLGLLAEERGVKVLAACADGGAARDAIRSLEPDVAMLDISMPVMTGIEVLAEVRRERLRTRVILLTATATNSEILEAVASGAKGVLLKAMAADDLVRCLSAVAAGGRWLPREVLDRALRADSPEAVAGEAACRALTSREREVTTLVAKGLSNKEIARQLDLMEGTVKLHLHNIYQKTGVKNRTGLAALALTYRDVLASI